MQILIADKLAAFVEKELTEAGAKVTLNPELTAESLVDNIQGYEILVVRSTKVDANVIDAADDLSLIIRAGAGVNTIDIEAASRRGIHVANCPGKNTAAVAELAIGLLIACDRRIVNASSDLKAGEWKKKEYQNAAGLKGRTLGIAGLGAIGSATAQRAQGLGMIVAGWSRSLTKERAEELKIRFCENPEELASISDAVSIHLASTPQTSKIIGSNFFDNLPQNSIFINTSRGEVVDREALIKAIKEKGIRAALDVYPSEPGSGTGPFEDTELAGCLTASTPHIGASTRQASEAVAYEVLSIITSYAITGIPVNAVNLREKVEVPATLVIRHFNRVGVLAGVLDELRSEGINIEEMENIIFQGGKAASCTLRLDAVPELSLIERISEKEEIIKISLS